jgi:hypothetical protein
MSGGRVVRAKGKGTSIRYTGKAPSGVVRKVKVIGRLEEDSTNAEAARIEFILALLKDRPEPEDASLALFI